MGSLGEVGGLEAGLDRNLCLLSGRQEDRCGLGYGYIDVGDTGKKGRHRRWATVTAW